MRKLQNAWAAKDGFRFQIRDCARVGVSHEAVPRVPRIAGSQFSRGWVIVAVSFVLLIGSSGTQVCLGLSLG